MRLRSSGDVGTASSRPCSADALAAAKWTFTGTGSALNRVFACLKRSGYSSASMIKNGVPSDTSWSGVNLSTIDGYRWSTKSVSASSSDSNSANVVTSAVADAPRAYAGESRQA